MIENHYTPKLSELDKRMAKAIPPGGNWKNIPESIPSKRLDRIRKDFVDGKGSRSTYYGRLKPEYPSYTITTYFNRPGNGCHLHFDPAQMRCISEREAARLQTFPDHFVFLGSHGSIHKQIGNAVPPLLAFQIAKEIPTKGYFVDLFCGAGGLSLGFISAGWKPIVGNDIERSFLETYKRNIHKSVVEGDIRDKNVKNEILKIFKEFKSQKKDKLPIWVLGGPPCQGFSTAGKKRTMSDERNHLFREYAKILEAINPDGFVFENVAGLLNMEGGEVFNMVVSTLSDHCQDIQVRKIDTERHGVPQRRKRVFLIGSKKKDGFVGELKKLTRLPNEDSALPIVVSVEQALNDLPAIDSGVKYEKLNYTSKPKNRYQKLMRGELTFEEFLKDYI